MKTPVRQSMVVVCLSIAVVGFLTWRPGATTGVPRKVNVAASHRPPVAQRLRPGHRHPAPVSQADQDHSAKPVPERRPDNPADRRQVSPAEAEIFERFDQWIDDYLAASSAEQVVLERAGKDLAVLRRSTLAAWIESDPERALEHAIPVRLRRDLPESIAQHLEERVSGLARFDVLAFSPTPGEPLPQTPIRRFATVNDRTYDAFVYGRRTAQTSKDAIPIHGIAIGNSLAVHESPVRLLEAGEAPDPSLPVGNPEGRCPISGSAANPAVAVETGGKTVYLCHAGHIDSLSQAIQAEEAGVGPNRIAAFVVPGGSSWTVGPKSVLFMRIIFPDDPTESISESDAYEMMSRVNDFFVANSYGVTSLAATVTPLLTMPYPKAWYTADNTYSAILDHARSAAAAAGFDSAGFNLDCVHLNHLYSSSWAFVGTKGVCLQSRDPGTACHEFGHSFGLMHANAWKSLDGGTIGNGVNLEYGNVFDRMGYGISGDCEFNTCHKSILHWLPDSAIQSVSTDGVYRLHPFAVPTLVEGQSYALKIQKDSERNYWIETRPTIPGDFSSLTGVQLNWSPWRSSGGGSQLLDTTPSSDGGRYDAPLLAGQNFYDSALGLKISPLITESTVPGSIDVLVQHVHCVFVEAEAGALYSSTAVVEDPLASQGRCITSSTAGSGKSTFTVEIPADGNYLIWCRIRTQFSGPAAAWVSVDGGQDRPGVGLDAPVPGTWQWSRLRIQSAGNFASSLPMLLPLSAGSHIIGLGIGGPDTKLDCLLVTDDPSVNPPPMLPGVADQVMVRTASSVSIPFTVANAGLTGRALKLTASSSNPSLVPVAGIEFSGGGENGALTIVPATNGLGTSVITVTVADSDGNSVNTSFQLTIIGVVQARVNAALPGDTVVLPSGIYSDRVTIDKDLVLEGAGPVGTVIDGGGSGVPLAINSNATVTIRNLTLRNGNQGGVRNYGTAVLDRCVVRDNVSSDFGGVWNGAAATLVLDRCTISGNRCRHSFGGGIYNAGTLMARTSTISGNRATEKDEPGEGGGIYNAGYLELHNCTVCQNVAGNRGGGIANSGTMILRSTIVAGNSVKNGDGPDCHGTITSAGYNLFQTTLGFDLVGGGTLDIVGQDPRLGPLQDNGGPTPTHALLADSPAIDRGSAGDPAIDQRGISRPVDVPDISNAGDACDIGAFEWVPGNFRQVRASIAAGAAPGTLVVRIVLESRGDENVVRINFRLPSKLSRVLDAVPGRDAQNATLTYGADSSSPERLSVALELPDGAVFRAGARELAVIELESGAGTVSESGYDLKIETGSASGVAGESLPAAYSVIVPAAAPSPRLSVSRASGGDVTVRLSGGAGYDWVVQASSDFVTWREVGMFANGGDTAEITDTSAHLYPYCFYRAVAR